MRPSRDGRYLALRTANAEASFLVVIPTEGGPAQEVLEMPRSQGWLRLADWTPDGRFLVYLVGFEGTSSLWRVPATGGAQLRLPLPMENAPDDLRISPDGTHFSVQMGRPQASLWVLENFLPS